MNKTTLTIPPPILLHFDSALLTNPMPKFCNDEKDIIDILMYVFNSMWGKLEKCPGKKRQCENLYQEIMRIYESIKKKKENSEAETKNITERPFYYFNCTTRSHEKILRGLVYKARGFSHGRKNREISQDGI